MLHNTGMQVEFRDHGHRDDWDPRRIAARLMADDVEMLLIAVTPPFGDRIGEAIRRCGFRGVTVNVGGSINMITGTAQMAPAWVRATKTEWLYRLLQEPRRLFRRYFVECLPVFLKHILPTYVRRPAARCVATALPADQHRISPRRLAPRLPPHATSSPIGVAFGCLGHASRRLAAVLSLLG